MEITKKIKKQKEDIHFVACAMSKTYIWKEDATIEEVKNAKKKYVSSYEKYLECIEKESLAEHETFAMQMLEMMPLKDDNPEYFSFTVKICLMIAYYYELLVEEIAGQKADEAEFIYGKSIECARKEYHQKYIKIVFSEV